MNQKFCDINDQIGKMVALQRFMDDVETLKEVFRLTSLALKVKDAFDCKVCLGAMKPPVIFATCFKKLIACKDYIPDIGDIGLNTPVLILEVQPEITLNSNNLMIFAFFRRIE